jgi:hypothetical protein
MAAIIRDRRQPEQGILCGSILANPSRKSLSIGGGFYMRLAIRHLLPGAVHLRLLGFDLGVPSVGFGKVVPIVGPHPRDAHPTEHPGLILPNLNRVGLWAVNQRGRLLPPASGENVNERRDD